MNHLLYEIVVIGAGLAGLAAADHLKSQGYNVKILEAENHVGEEAFISGFLKVYFTY